MAEIQQGAHVAFALVPGDNMGLDFAGSTDCVGQGRRVAPGEIVDVEFQPVKQQRVLDATVLDHFGQPGPQLAVREGRQGIGIGDDGERLIERADEILAARMVDAGFTAHGGIHLCQQGRRQLHVADAALIARRGETRDVADHSAAQRQDGGIAVESGVDQGIEHASDGVQRLVLFAVGQHAMDDTPGVAAPAVATRGGECRLQFLEVEARNGRVGDHTQVAAGDERIQQLAVAQQAGSDLDGVNRVSDVYLECLHGSRIIRLLRTICPTEVCKYTTTPRSASARRFSGSITAPPPVARTMDSMRLRRSMDSRSRILNPASPSFSKMKEISTPVLASISASLSRNVKRNNLAKWRPTAVLPEPMGPMRKMFRMAGMRGES